MLKLNQDNIPHNKVVKHKGIIQTKTIPKLVVTMYKPIIHQIRRKDKSLNSICLSNRTKLLITFDSIESMLEQQETTSQMSIAWSTRRRRTLAGSELTTYTHI